MLDSCILSNFKLQKLRPYSYTLLSRVAIRYPNDRKPTLFRVPPIAIWAFNPNIVVYASDKIKVHLYNIWTITPYETEKDIKSPFIKNFCKYQYRLFPVSWAESNNRKINSLFSRAIHLTHMHANQVGIKRPINSIIITCKQ